MFSFNFVMGVTGLVLSGHSLGKKLFLLGAVEFATGLYFTIAAIGAAG